VYSLTLKEIKDKINKKEVKIKDVLDVIYKRIEDKEPKINSFINLTKDYAYSRAEELQKKLDLGEDIGNLGGIPIAIKDNICTKNIQTTCGSKMLENFVSPYNATVIDLLEKQGAIIIGKTNMDEFAMGSSTESSYFNITKNPWNTEYVPGGSSGGSAAAVSADMAYASLGSDTGGSIRQPASYVSLVGIKPSYGLVSRYGLVAYGSSLDQIGTFTKNVEDMALMLNCIVGYDEKDTTSMNLEKLDYTKYLVNDIKNFKIGVPYSFLNGASEDVKNSFENSINIFKKLGANIVDIDYEYIKYSLATYYIIAMAEASSNLGRYDGIKYGYRTEDYNSLEDIYVNSRSEGFGDEVKRRILLGTYVLSSGYYDAYYAKAGKVRNLIINEFKEKFKDLDCIITPTAPNTSFKIGQKSNNPVEMYLEDLYTVPVNLAGLPGVSIPCGFDKNNLPIGLQLIGDNFREDRLIQIAYTFESNTDFSKERPGV
jgi:aspartyl-tRNA(Asn)/glutamyl-tRNA(Gln) amidotransferase subunit A